VFKATFLGYRFAAARRSSIERNQQSETADEARLLCGTIAEVAIRARWSRDPQVIVVALLLIERRAPLASKLAQMLAAAR
jgi:hypothetical protein